MNRNASSRAEPSSRNAGLTAKQANAVLDLVLATRPNAEERPQQRAMVMAVATSLDQRRPLLVQAGTGVGKSLAYLAAAAASKRRVVVSTATRQLQTQLARDDAPTISEAAKSLGLRFNVTVLKGRSNYLCRRDFAQASADEVAVQQTLDVAPTEATSGPVWQNPAWQELTEWVANTPDGDRANAPVVSDALWAAVSTDSAGCPGANTCTYGSTCFAEDARAMARDADVVITNHALTAIELASDDPFIHRDATVILDEAHQAENYFSSAWGHTLDPEVVATLVRAVGRQVPSANQSARDTATALARLCESLTISCLELKEGRITALPDALRDALTTMRADITKLAAALKATDKANPPAASDTTTKESQTRLLNIVDDIDAIAAGAKGKDTGTVVWLEFGSAHVAAPVLRTAPLHIGPLLTKFLAQRTLIATSATLTVGTDFGPLASSLGLDQPVTRVTSDDHDADFDAVDVGTPFDFDSQAMLYVPPRSFPAPVGQSRDAHTKAALEQTTKLVTAAGGRSLVLSTSTAGAQRFAAHLAKELPPSIRVLAQGDAPAAALTAQFIDDETSVLCATSGMWAGLNVPGPSLTLVVIDKLPFPRPDDPLNSARCDAADAAGSSGFSQISLAHAALHLAQGAGRLIRTRTDRGIIAVLDPRLLAKPYGKTLLASLPAMRRTSDLQVVVDALGRLIA